LRSELRFGSFLVYAPRGTSEVSRKAQQFVRALKEERPIGVPRQSPTDYAARRLADELPLRCCRSCFVQTSPVEFELDVKSSVLYFPVDHMLADKLRAVAASHRVSTETLLNL